MSTAFHRVVWLDHLSARLFDVTRDQAVETALIRAPDRAGHIHHKAGTPGPGHDGVATTFLHQVGDALAGAQEILIVGPGEARTALKHHLDEHFPAIAARVVDVRPMAKASAGEIHAVAGRIFRRTDRMAPRPGAR